MRLTSIENPLSKNNIYCFYFTQKKRKYSCNSAIVDEKIYFPR
jgi:hypothetical protein